MILLSGLPFAAAAEMPPQQNGLFAGALPAVNLGGTL